MLNKLKGYVLKGYSLVKNNLTEAAMVAFSGIAGGLLLGGRAGILMGCVLGALYIFVANKVKD
jgi:hypothetical protein